MAKRVCSQPGCPTLVGADAYRGFCDQHRREWDRKRGSRADRGYGAEHAAERARTQSLIDAGATVLCVTCGKRLKGRDWHMGHTADRTGYKGPQCAQCNLSEAGRASHHRNP